MTVNDQHLPWINAALVQQTVAAFNHSHAILITGPDGIGKSHLASKVCQQLLPETSLIEAGTHPDLHILTSAYSFNQVDMHLQNSTFRYLDVEALGKKRLSRQISVESIRSLIEIMSESAGMGGHKLVVIYPAEDLNRNAANALLKFLEEPADKTLIILISHDISKLPATIRSRCMRIDMKAPAQAESIDWLEQIHSDHSKEQINSALSLAADKPLLASQYLAVNQLSVAEKLTADFERIVTGDKNIVTIAKVWLKFKQTDFILHWFCCFISDLIKLKSGCSGHFNDRHQSILTERLPINNLFDLYDYLVDTNKHYDGVTDEALLLEDLLLKVSAAAKG